MDWRLGRHSVAVAILLLLGSPVGAVTLEDTGCTVFTDSADGDDADDGSTWALANATFAGSLSDWGTSDVLCIADDHAETGTGGATYTATGDTISIPVPVYSVDRDNSDAYLPGAAAQIAWTNNPDDLNFDGHFRIYGVYFKTQDNMNLNVSGSTSFWAQDVTLELATFGSKLISTSSTPALIYMKDSTVNFSHASGGSIEMDERVLSWDGMTFSGNLAGDMFGNASANFVMIFRCTGCDLSAYSGATLMDYGFAATNKSLELIGGLLPATVTLHDSSFTNPFPNQYVYLSGTDDGTGNESFRTELYTLQGDIILDTGVYHDSGLTFTEGSSNASIKFSPAANAADHPLCSWGAFEWINSTGSKTFTTEVVENYTSALTLSEVWQEVFYLGTSGSPEWTLDVGQDVDSSTALSAGTGLGNWTGEPASSRSVKLTTTVTVNKAGLYQIRWCTNAFESGKVIHVDPDPSIS